MGGALRPNEYSVSTVVAENIQTFIRNANQWGSIFYQIP
jgi:hypothetical protein